MDPIIEGLARTLAFTSSIMGNVWGLKTTPSEMVHLTYAVMGSLVGWCFEHRLKGRTVTGRPVRMMAWTRVGVSGKWSDSGHTLMRSREDIVSNWMWDERNDCPVFDLNVLNYLTNIGWNEEQVFIQSRGKKSFRFYYYKISVKRPPSFNP